MGWTLNNCVQNGSFVTLVCSCYFFENDIRNCIVNVCNHDAASTTNVLKVLLAFISANGMK